MRPSFLILLFSVNAFANVESGISNRVCLSIPGQSNAQPEDFVVCSDIKVAAELENLDGELSVTRPSIQVYRELLMKALRLNKPLTHDFLSNYVDDTVVRNGKIDEDRLYYLMYIFGLETSEVVGFSILIEMAFRNPEFADHLARNTSIEPTSDIQTKETEAASLCASALQNRADN